MENEEKQNLRQQQQRPMEQEPPPPPKCRPFPLTVPLSSSRPYHPYAQVVIAHRGASAHLPEHSLAGYRLALELGADYLEPDLVSTQDRHLVALHSLDLTTTTNVLSRCMDNPRIKPLHPIVRENWDIGCMILRSPNSNACV